MLLSSRLLSAAHHLQAVKTQDTAHHAKYPASADFTEAEAQPKGMKLVRAFNMKRKNQTERDRRST